MRRSWWIFGTGLLLAGCGNLRDLFTAQADVAAEANGLALRSDSLAAIMTAGQAPQPSLEAAEYIANLWVDYALLAQAAAKPAALRDSATIAEAVWPEVSERVGGRWHDTLLARRNPVSPVVADSIYNGNDLRVLQHILISLPNQATAPQRDAAQRKIEGILALARAGSDFGALAARFTEDPGSKNTGGIYPPAPRGQYVAAFDSAGWLLKPGQISGVVRTPFGLHIIRRPPLEEVRPLIVQWLARQAGSRLDSLYMDSLLTRHGVKVASGAARAVRGAVADRASAAKSTRAVVRYDGGTVTLAQFARWVDALPPQYVAQLEQSPDSGVERFIQIIAQNVLLLDEARAAGVTLQAEEWQAIAGQYGTQLDTLLVTMGLNDPAVTDSTHSLRDREQAAAAKFTVYFADVLGNRARLIPLPSQLRTVLRGRYPFSVDAAGVRRGLQLAQAKVPAAPAPGLTPSPGGPPIDSAPVPRSGGQ